MEEDDIKQELNNIQDLIGNLKNEEYKIKQRYTELLKQECRKNINRCFEKSRNGKIIAYCKIIDIDKSNETMHGEIYFNEYQYPAIWFNYPYDDSYLPFYEDNLFSGAWGKGNDYLGELNKIAYREITIDDFIEKFSEINNQWRKKLY